MAYIESYIMPVVAAQFEQYRDIAAKSAEIWKEMGALSVTEALADNAPVGTVTSFPRSVQLKDGEVVVVAYLTFRDRSHRDQVMEKMENDDRMEAMFRTAPVDGKRMIWGGFESFVSV